MKLKMSKCISVFYLVIALSFFTLVGADELKSSGNNNYSGNIVSSSWQKATDHLSDCGAASQTSVVNLQKMKGSGSAFGSSVAALEMYLGQEAPYHNKVNGGETFGNNVMDALLKTTSGKSCGKLAIDYSAYHKAVTTTNAGKKVLAATIKTKTGYSVRIKGANPAIDVNNYTIDGYSIQTPSGKFMYGYTETSLSSKSSCRP